MFRTLSDLNSNAITITIDGVSAAARSGETVAAVLLRQPEPWSRTTEDGAPRAPYCMMGVCFECRATVNGQLSTQTCRTPVQEGMRVERETGRPSLN